MAEAYQLDSGLVRWWMMRLSTEEKLHSLHIIRSERIDNVLNSLSHFHLFASRAALDLIRMHLLENRRTNALDM